MFFTVTCHATKDATFFAMFVKYLARLVNKSDIKTNNLLNFINITCVSSLLNLHKIALYANKKMELKEVNLCF